MPTWVAATTHPGPDCRAVRKQSADLVALLRHAAAQEPTYFMFMEASLACFGL